MLEQCGDFCGWTVAFIGVMFKGSFAVPMKSEASERVDVDPMVFQTYKSVMFFIVSFIATPLILGMDGIVFSKWGFVSGLLWVPGGVAGIYAVRKAGLAVSQGTWSSIIVIASFLWGIIIFNEHTKSITNTVIAIIILNFGLWGMAFYSSPAYQGYKQADDSTLHIVDKSLDMEISALTNSMHSSKSVENDLNIAEGAKNVDDDDNIKMLSLLFGCFKISQRQLGIACACLNGITAGSMLVPIHYLPDDVKGLPYSISFGVGALCVTALLWIIRFHYYLCITKSFYYAYQALPPLYFKEMWRSGCTSGFLWSAGNICSIIAVTSLGQGIGYSVIQASMLISGLWGIYFYQEVTDIKARLRWFMSAVATVFAIILLGNQHIKNQGISSVVHQLMV